MLSNYVTNEFKNSAVAQSKRDVRTHWSDAKAMTIATGLVTLALIVIFVIKY